MATAASSHDLNFWGVHSASKRIIDAHSRHFLALSVVFLLPLAFGLIIYPTLEATLSEPNCFIHFVPQQTLFYLSFYDTYLEPTHIQIVLPLFYGLFFTLFSVLAVATITRSTFYGFYGRPVKLVSSVKSIFKFFFPLLCTLLVSQLIMSLIIVSYGILVGIVYKCLGLFGFEISLDSKYFTGFMIFVGMIVILALVALQVNWALASVVVVVECKWGFEPLKRSASLLRGMKWVSLSVLLFYGISIWLVVGTCWLFVIIEEGRVAPWPNFFFVVPTVLASGLLTLLMLYNITVNVVLYMYCKALQGELASEIAQEFANDYVSLPFDDKKVPHVVSVAQV